MSSFREYHVFPNSFVMGPGLTQIGGSHVIDSTKDNVTSTITTLDVQSIAFVGSAAGGTTSGGRFTVNLPAGVAPGDIVVVAQSMYRPTDYTVGVYAPSGYTTVADQYVNGTADTNSFVGYKIMTDPVDTYVEFMASDHSAYTNAAVLHVWRNVNASQPMDVTPVTAQGTGSAYPNPAAITPSTKGAVIVLCAGTLSQNYWGLNPPTEHKNTIHRCTVRGGDQSVHAILSSIDWDGNGAYDCPIYTRPSDSYEEGQAAYHTWTAVSIALRPA